MNEKKISLNDVIDLIHLHEFNLIFVPGVVFFTGLLFYFPQAYNSFPIKNNNLLIFIIYLPFSYASGYFVEAVGNRLEKLVEVIFGNIKNKSHIEKIVSPGAKHTLVTTLHEQHILSSQDLGSIRQKEWEEIIGMMKSKIKIKDLTNKLHIFNNQCKLCRGLSASCLLLLLLGYVTPNTNPILLLTLFAPFTLGFLWYMRNWEKRELRTIYETYPLLSK